MGLRQMLRDMLGVTEMTHLLELDRQAHQQMLQEIIRISALQAETATRLVGTLELVMASYAVDGPPEGRHMTDELEVEIFEQVGHGRDS